MKLIWNLYSTPELAELPSDDRGRLVRQSVRRAFLHWQMYLAIALAGVGVAGGWFLGEQFDEPLAGLFFGSVIGSLVGNLIINRFVYSHYIKTNQ